MTSESLGLAQDDLRILVEFFQSPARRVAMSKLLEKRLADKTEVLRSNVTRGLHHDATVNAGELREITELAAVFTELSS